MEKKSRFEFADDIVEDIDKKILTLSDAQIEDISYLPISKLACIIKK